MRYFRLINLAIILASIIVFSMYMRIELRPQSTISFAREKLLIVPPVNPFKMSPENYEAIASGPLSLKWVAPSPELPDLKGIVSYFGKNGRPDLKAAVFRLGIKNNEEPKNFSSKEKIYLCYREGQFYFSPQNQKTALYLEILPASSDDELKLAVYMHDAQNKVITSPQTLHTLSLKAETTRGYNFPNIELGSYRADTSLLCRQHAAWLGRDVFLEMHGGEEFAHILGKQRIDFLDPENPYTCFVKEGDYLIWKDEKWQIAKESESPSFHLLFVKKIDERVMSFELWDIEGKGKLHLNLLRTKLPEEMPSIEQEFKFIGAKTWSQFIVESKGKRMILRNADWLFRGPENWEKIHTVEQLDAYVEQKVRAPLLILDTVLKVDGKEILKGHLFNTSRTEMQEIELFNEKIFPEERK